ncbi:MAG: hypothetical protein PVSMB4_15820 [Ktedonobacterales bacterium]
MPYTMVRFKVQDYATWRQGLEEGVAMRQASSGRGGWIFRGASDPNEIVLLLEWDDLAQGMRLGQSPEMQEIQRRGGVITRPELYTAAERFER